MAVQPQYNNNDYKNWLKACLGLKYLKIGIVDFIDAEVKQLHASILAKVCGAGTCNQCLTNRIIDRRRHHQCPNNICDKICKEIEYHHRFTRPCWENTDATKWCTDYWEIGKCFMSKGYASVSTAAETDCAGLLSVCINGKFLPPTITGQIIHLPGLGPGAPMDIFHKNRDSRNALLHSGSMSISDAERRDYIDDMIKLLTNYKTPVDRVSQDAIDNLHEVNSVDINIVPSIELSLLQTKLVAMTLRQTHLEEQIQDQRTEYGPNKEDIQNNAAALVTLRQKLDEFHRESGEDIAEVQNTCTTLQETCTKLHETCTAFQDKTEQFHKCLSEMGIKVKQIDEAKIIVDSIRKDMRSIFADRKYEQSINDVQDFLMAKYKRDSSDVPMSPILRTHCAHVDEIYTELIVRDDLVHKPNGKTEPPTFEALDSHAYQKKGRNVATTKSYRDVLYDDKTACKNIYVVGNAGIGKTTWSRKFVATWIKAIENKRTQRKLNKNENSDDKGKPEENEIVLREYDHVFYIALRHATADHDVMQMIKHQLFPHHPYLLKAARILLNNPDSSSRCIIILDGLDEWCSAGDTPLEDGTPFRDPTWKCVTITTTRSWKLEELQLGTNKINRAVEIQGLDKRGTDKLIDHVVAVLNKKTAKSKSASDFRSQISQSVRACMQVPLLLTILVCLWHDGKQLNTHLAGTYSEMIEMLIRCAEGETRKKRFHKPKKLSAMKRKWAYEKSLPPESLHMSAKQLFVQYLPFLLRLGKLAFNMLFSKRKESTLVFDYATIETFLSEDELDLSVKIGILSKATHSGSVLRQEFRLSFLHKTVQEYLAALYMVSGDCQSECLDKFKTYCKYSWDILEMENVLLFIYGLSPETSGEIYDFISKMEPNARIHSLLLRCSLQEELSCEMFNVIVSDLLHNSFMDNPNNTRVGGSDPVRNRFMDNPNNTRVGGSDPVRNRFMDNPNNTRVGGSDPLRNRFMDNPNNTRVGGSDPLRNRFRDNPNNITRVGGSDPLRNRFMDNPNNTRVGGSDPLRNRFMDNPNNTRVGGSDPLRNRFRDNPNNTRVGGSDPLHNSFMDNPNNTRVGGSDPLHNSFMDNPNNTRVGGSDPLHNSFMDNPNNTRVGGSDPVRNRFMDNPNNTLWQGIDFEPDLVPTASNDNIFWPRFSRHRPRLFRHRLGVQSDSVSKASSDKSKNSLRQA